MPFGVGSERVEAIWSREDHKDEMEPVDVCGGDVGIPGEGVGVVAVWEFCFLSDWAVVHGDAGLLGESYAHPIGTRKC